MAPVGGRSHRIPPVDVVGGDEASGMAEMLGGVLRGNVHDYRGRAWAVAHARGEVVFTARDRDQSVTLAFGPGSVRVSDGVASGAPQISGPWLVLADVCSGRCTPLRALRQGDLRLVGAPSAVVATAAFALSVPSSFYGDRPPVAPKVVILLVLLATVAALLVLGRRGKERTP